MPRERGGAPLQHDHERELPAHGAPADGDGRAERHQPQPQRVRNGGGMEPVEREIKAEQAEYGREHREQAPEHT